MKLFVYYYTTDGKLSSSKLISDQDYELEVSRATVMTRIYDTINVVGTTITTAPNAVRVEIFDRPDATICADWRHKLTINQHRYRPKPMVQM